MTLAISSSRKDAIIEKMTVLVTHEHGETHELTWVVLSETQGEWRSAEGETVEMAKNQPAVALKVSTLNLTEKKVLFQDLAYQEKQRALTNRLTDSYNLAKANKEENAVERALKTLEFSQARDNFRDSMYWKEGRYVFTVRLHEVRAGTPHAERFEVSLVKADVDTLRRNTDTFEAFVRFGLSIPEEGTTGDSKAPVWYWAYPRIKRLKG